MGTVDLLARFAKVVVDFADIRDVFSRAIRMGNVGCGRDVVVPRAPESPPPVVLLPVPFVEPPGTVFSLADALSQGMLVFIFAQVDEQIELELTWNVDLRRHHLEDRFFSEEPDGPFAIASPSQHLLDFHHVNFLLAPCAPPCPKPPVQWRL